MLHHLSITATDPRRVADGLARLLDGRVSRFGPVDGAFLAWSPDSAGTAIEVYPQGTELVPDRNAPAKYNKNLFASKLSGTHATISVDKDEAEIAKIVGKLGWPIARQNRGGFDVLECWVERDKLISIFTPAMLQRYLAMVKVPHVPAEGAVDSISIQQTIGADPATAFAAWSDPTTLMSWWPMVSADIDLRIGGRYELLFAENEPAGSQGSEGCTILSYLPDKMLSFTWNAPAHLPVRGAQTWVVLEFSPASGGTKIEVTQAGFMTGPQWAQCRSYFHQAWRRVLRRMQQTWPVQVNQEQPDVVDLRIPQRRESPSEV